MKSGFIEQFANSGFSSFFGDILRNVRKTELLRFNWKPDLYLDGIACSVHGFIADKKIEVFNASGQPPGGLITDFGSFFHSYRTGYNELGLIVTRIPQFGIPEKKNRENRSEKLQTLNYMKNSWKYGDLTRKITKLRKSEKFVKVNRFWHSNLTRKTFNLTLEVLSFWPEFSVLNRFQFY